MYICSFGLEAGLIEFSAFLAEEERGLGKRSPCIKNYLPVLYLAVGGTRPVPDRGLACRLVY